MEHTALTCHENIVAVHLRGSEYMVVISKPIKIGHS